MEVTKKKREVGQLESRLNLQQTQDTTRFLSQASIELQSLFQPSNSHGHGGILQVSGQLG
jgi:hypothetical protein